MTSGADIVDGVVGAEEIIVERGAGRATITSLIGRAALIDGDTNRFKTDQILDAAAIVAVGDSTPELEGHFVVTLAERAFELTEEATALEKRAQLLRDRAEQLYARSAIGVLNWRLNGDFSPEVKKNMEAGGQNRWVRFLDDQASEQSS